MKNKTLRGGRSDRKENGENIKKNRQHQYSLAVPQLALHGDIN